MALFNVMDEEGRTHCQQPRYEALKYQAMLQYQGRLTTVIEQGGEVKVTSPGLMDAIFAPEEC